MYLTLDTTAILVADRRSARELAASRRRSFATRFRRASGLAPQVPATLPTSTGRTPVAVACQAA